METSTSIQTYYKRIIDLIIEQGHNDFSSATAGHCMKITGFGSSELEYLWERLITSYPGIDTFIIAEESKGSKYISATKLIEYRNKQERPLLVLIPSNSRTAAEDSYGNATFKEFALEGIEKSLLTKLLSECPIEIKAAIEDLFEYLSNESLSQTNKINYLLDLHEKGYSADNLGKLLFHLNLIPDSNLLKEKAKVRPRLSFNIQSIKILSSFSKPIYDRITELPLEPNSIQRDIVDFLKNENNAKSAEALTELIYTSYSQLNFSNWPIPEIDPKDVKLYVDYIKSSNFKIEEGDKVLHAESDKISKVKIRLRTTPKPKDVPELKFFKVVLMSVDGGHAEEVLTLRKLKNTTAQSSFRDATVELHANLIEEGTYFFRVIAEDEYGTVLNSDDNLLDEKAQKAWENAKKKNPSALKSSFGLKYTSDSENFYFAVTEVAPNTEEQRKDKVYNVLQAFFRFRLDNLKNDQELSFPSPSDSSNTWLNEGKLKHTSTFYINYSLKDNYQINLSTKLRAIEDCILNNHYSFGYIDATVDNNSASLGLPSIDFKESKLTSIIPTEIKKRRSTIFKKIQVSNSNKNGVFETADLFNYIDEIKEYIVSFTAWTTQIKSKLTNEELTPEEREELKGFLTHLQFLDIVRVQTKLPDGKDIVACLLSPLHPLRLSWFTQLYEVFIDWEEKTKTYDSHKQEWSKNLESLFEGILSPENNPLVLVDPVTYKYYHYSGELTYGWGVYLGAPQQKKLKTLASSNRQFKHYLRQLFNITKESYIETDISLKLVVRHLKNYLLQHPYTDKLTINLINAGDAGVFADALVELEKEPVYRNVKYEVRLFKGDDKIIEHGEALSSLLNPESNITEEAESFSQPSKNRLFPKLRYSINYINDYLERPVDFASHISFLVSPFSVHIELVKPHSSLRNFYLNGLITDPTVVVEEKGEQIKWNRFINPDETNVNASKLGKAGIELFKNLQGFTASVLATKLTSSLTATQLSLNEKDKVLIAHLHEYSDWVVTFDKNIGPQVFDQPSKDGRIPFLLDYVPGEEISGISSFLTTSPSSEIIGLMGPHFEDFGLDVHNTENEEKLKILLEDLRAVSSSLVLQLNSTKNKAFEVIGSAFTKRVLEKKGFLNDSFLVPIDLHQNLFEDLPSDSKSRADNLLVSFDTVKKEIQITVIEIKCRKYLGQADKEELKSKIKSQIDNTITALRQHFDPENSYSFDRLDREIKNKELKSLLSFYIERGHRYKYLSDNAYETYIDFLQNLDSGFSIKFKQLGLIFDMGAAKKHEKEIIDSELTVFTFGGKLISDILDPDSDLNTRRVEDEEINRELEDVIGTSRRLDPFIKKFVSTHKNSEIQVEVDNTHSTSREGITAVPYKQESEITSTAPEDVIDNKVNDQGGLHIEKPDQTGIIPATNVNGAESKDQTDHVAPEYDILIGKSSPSAQYGIIGKSIHNKSIAIDLSETNTISLFGVQGGGKSYTIGTVSEMVLKQFSNVNKLPAPLAGVIFHYSESMDYEPEFTSMIYPNDKASELAKLKTEYGAEPENIEDVIILTPKDKIEERQSDYPSIQVLPIAFNSKELNVQDWMFLLGAIGNDSSYIKELKAIMKEHRRNITINVIKDSVDASVLLNNTQKALARQRLNFADEYIDDTFYLKDVLKPGRLIIVDLRDEFIVKDEALGLFVIMLNIFSGVRNFDDKHFNKFIVFDEAHKYMDNKDLTGNIVTAIREMRHKGVSIMIASQDPPSLPNEIIELSSVVLVHKFNSPQWLKHIQKSVIQLASLSPADLAVLNPGEGFLWASKATEKSISNKPMKITTRPRVTKHGGGTIEAIGK